MNVLVCLASILLLLMILIGGRKGARSFIALFLNFGVLFFTILFMADPNLDPILLTLAACGVISCINLFFINEVNKKTTTAFISTIITLAILFMIIVMLTDHTMIQGFGEEESEELSMFSRYIGVDFIRIGASVIIMSTIGAITDIAISITSPMHEIVKHNPSISRKDLYASGIEIGRDILGTNTNTLFFAFFGSYLGLLIWFKELSYSLGDIVNSKVFSAEIITILCAGIGVAIIIPIASWIAAAFFIMKKESAEQDK
ncbi:YibE/F family protein [Metabacillus idriensis]|uniref:YibE/F family protein n=1 Tax=Metabacillus idriensis TaxID=324768 RepID=A0A6I2M508_9BACI|nr:YibE/F family protein [Metabacillus idriensis]MCM3594959.1 YibE/F family protein [Metabacillus idriensis]MRX53019.1 YibE/F family protein [Metabacillus idriensis]OHR67111.1 YibE/F [Bacillus sp. HMSC76G11]